MSAYVQVVAVRAGYRGDGSVAEPLPRLGWKASTDLPEWRQRAAELEWTSGGRRTLATVEGPASFDVDWPFRPIVPGERGELRVRIHGVDGSSSEWSEGLELVARFLAPEDWHAPFIRHPDTRRPDAVYLLRREFELEADVEVATLSITARGAFRAEVNEHEFTDSVLSPGWTAYDSRITYETHDVTPLLVAGRNAVGIELAGAWFTERYGFDGYAHPKYGTHPSLSAQLDVRYRDGRSARLVTDSDWRVTDEGPTRASGIYDGEQYDARLAKLRWSAPGFDDTGWVEADIDARSGPTPTPRADPPVERIETIAVKEIITSPTGRTILDFGQNLVGRLRIRVEGQAGATVRVRHAEVLEAGELSVRPLRRASATDTFTMGEQSPAVWEPAFTFHGFRYAEIDGWPGELRPDSVTAVVLHSRMERTGWFECSDDLVNRLHENVVWGMRGNFLSIPTDCPQRDERLGWTGDIQVFAPTASFLYDCEGFLRSWLQDLAGEQKAVGTVPWVVPNATPTPENGAAAWGDAATVVPWVLYRRFGSRSVLEDQYDSMKAWVDEIIGAAGPRRLWEGRFQFGDWLDPAAPADDPARATTDPDLVASAYLHLSTRILADAAEVLGHAVDADRYAALADEVRAAWQSEYVTPMGRIVSDTQTAYALALAFDLVVEADLRRALGDRLAELVRRGGYRIGSGFVGTPIVQDALHSTGHDDVAGRLLLQTEHPSWLYPVTMGATTIWERWDSMLPDGTVNLGEMTSFNHYALGAVADWLHRVVAGLRTLEPGYVRFGVVPTPIPGLTHARATFESPVGRIVCGWLLDEDGLSVAVQVPPNATALVELPGRSPFEVGSGRHEWRVPASRRVEATPRFTLDSSLAAVIDDPQVYEAVAKAIEQIDPARALDFRQRTKWVAQRKLRGLMYMASREVVQAVTGALDALADERVDH